MNTSDTRPNEHETNDAGGTSPRLRSRPLIGTGDGLVEVGAGTRLPGVAVTAVHAGADGVWVLGDRRDLYHLDGAGARRVARLAPSDEGVCLGRHAGHVWVGGDRAGLWRLAGDRLEPVTSFQEAPSRERWSTPWGGPPSVFSMAAHGGDLYVSVHVGGIMRTADRGRSWNPTIDLEVDVHHVAVDRDGAVWAADGGGGLAQSTDRGASWRVHTDGLHGRYLTAVAATTDGVLVAAASGHGARDGALYRFDRADGRFEACGGELPERLGGIVAPRHLAAAGDEALVAVPDGGVLASDDGGRTWRRIAEGLSRIGEVVLAPAEPRR